MTKILDAGFKMPWLNIPGAEPEVTFTSFPVFCFHGFSESRIFFRVSNLPTSGSMAPQDFFFFSKSCSFQALLRENPYFEQILGSDGGGKTLGPPEQNLGSPPPAAPPPLRTVILELRFGSNRSFEIIFLKQ